jgi:hypothetical protein
LQVALFPNLIHLSEHDPLPSLQKGLEFGVHAPQRLQAFM